MKLILLESVAGLGRPGDQVNVKNGFARNYLLPQRKAVVRTDDSMRMLGKLQAKADAEERALISSMEELSAKLKGLAVEVMARATDDGHLFGSVTEKDIHLAIVAAGWDVALRAVRLPMHLKDAGVHEVVLHLYGEILVPISVEVVPIDMEGTRIEPMGQARAEGSEDDPAKSGEADDAASAEGEAPPADGQAAATAEA
jgi:large subunit ribosomal protein L9